MESISSPPGFLILWDRHQENNVQRIKTQLLILLGLCVLFFGSLVFFGRRIASFPSPSSLVWHQFLCFPIFLPFWPAPFTGPAPFQLLFSSFFAPPSCAFGLGGVVPFPSHPLLTSAFYRALLLRAPFSGTPAAVFGFGVLRKSTFRKLAVPDVPQTVLNTSFTKFSLPEARPSAERFCEGSKPMVPFWGR